MRHLEINFFFNTKKRARLSAKHHILHARYPTITILRPKNAVNQAITALILLEVLIGFENDHRVGVFTGRGL